MLLVPLFHAGSCCAPRNMTQFRRWRWSCMGERLSTAAPPLRDWETRHEVPGPAWPALWGGLREAIRLPELSLPNHKMRSLVRFQSYSNPLQGCGCREASRSSCSNNEKALIKSSNKSHTRYQEETSALLGLMIFIQGTTLGKFPATTNWGAVISCPTKQGLLFSLLLSLVSLKTHESLQLTKLDI